MLRWSSQETWKGLAEVVVRERLEGGQVGEYWGDDERRGDKAMGVGGESEWRKRS